MGLGLHSALSRWTFPLNSFVARRLPARRLAVLTYHRVARPEQIWPAAVSVAECQPADFEAQMTWVREHTDPVDAGSAAEIIEGRRRSPRRPVLVTFDDAYRDDLQRVRPCLERLGIRPLVFLPTGYVGTRRRFWWDRIAVCVQTTARPRLTTRLAEEQTLPLGSPSDRAQAEAGLSQHAEGLRAADRERFIGELEEQLGVPSTAEAERPVVVSWEEVAALRASFDFGAHTVSHPILSTLRREELRGELAESKAAVEAHLGEPCVTFAIPDGRAKDYTPETLQVAAAVGFRLVFSLEDKLRAPLATAGSSWLVDRVSMFRVAGAAGAAAKLTWPSIFVPPWAELARDRLHALRRRH